MRAVQISQIGGPEVLEYVECLTPVPDENEVLIKAHSIGVGMPDVLVRTGRYPWMPPMPAIIGIEMSGHVVQTGSKVKDMKVGEAVFVSARELAFRGNCYAEYLCANASAVYPLPEGVDLEMAACLSNYQVAWHLLNSAPNGHRFESILVWAAAGGVGSAVVELAKLAGKHVIGIAGSKEKCDFVLGLGAVACIDYKISNVGEVVAELTNGRGVDLVLDPVGGKEFHRNFSYLAPLGLVINYGMLQGWPDTSYAAAMQQRFGDSPGFRFFSMHVFDQLPERRKAATGELLSLLAKGKIRPSISHRMPLAQARLAHEIFDSGSVIGKMLLKP
jgi:NADPH2:quinone reductase